MDYRPSEVEKPMGSINQPMFWGADKSPAIHLMISKSDYRDMLLRLDKNKVREGSAGNPVDLESTLHDQIIAHCNSQWPKWKYIRARMDKRSTIQVGAADFCPIYLPGGRILIFEAKRPGEKLTQEQQAWHKELEMLGHKTYVGTCFQDFLNAVDEVLYRQK